MKFKDTQLQKSCDGYLCELTDASEDLRDELSRLAGERLKIPAEINPS